MKHLVAIECSGSLPISTHSQEGVTPEEADELAAYVRQQGLDEEGIVFTRHEVRFMNYVGFIQLSSCSVEVLPKVTGNDPAHSRRVLLRMLQRSGFLDFHESQVSQLKLERMNLMEIIGYLFTYQLTREMRKGIYRTYQSEQGELHLVRGKIDMNRQLRREAMMQGGVSCLYDEFQINHPLNQVFMAALLLVISRCKYTETRKAAASCLALLDGVTSVTTNQALMGRVHFDRTNRRFQPCFTLAKLLISQSAPVPTPGSSRSSSILFKMNDLFEAYVSYLARKVCNRVTVKDRTHKLLVQAGSNRGVFQLEPDLLLENLSGQTVIVDTKWKLLHSSRARHGVQRQDFYQMYAYLTRYKDVGSVILLYPHHEGVHASGECLESWHLEGNPNKWLKVYTIDYENEYKAGRDLQQLINA
ncbi:hypothetical protein MJA45_03955 [Paenibacillus aurantius]|uniref:Restriction endonuclease n=1 Tax=Paenibacillus aurantius TaxID=2918900 RepID=A0AA96LHM4_9BACL|nr:hypothetical protein [Paenibacillus aurantius]WNQ12215.1 hypothetical protein MJA45_03955 [Paenibacillus aurantius]